MWTQKHHHCSISLTSRRLILVRQLFPGILTRWHLIHSCWSHTDTIQSHSVNCIRKITPVQSQQHKQQPPTQPSRGAPGQEISTQISHHSKGEKRKSLGWNICYLGFLYHSTAQLCFHMEHPRLTQHKICWNVQRASLSQTSWYLQAEGRKA